MTSILKWCICFVLCLLWHYGWGRNTETMNLLGTKCTLWNWSFGYANFSYFVFSSQVRLVNFFIAVLCFGWVRWHLLVLVPLCNFHATSPGLNPDPSLHSELANGQLLSRVLRFVVSLTLRLSKLGVRELAMRGFYSDHMRDRDEDLCLWDEGLRLSLLGCSSMFWKRGILYSYRFMLSLFPNQTCCSLLELFTLG